MKKIKKIISAISSDEPAVKSGFTLIELLVVISIIGLLTALIVVNFNAVRERARDVQRKSDLDQIKKALRMFYNDFGSSYPATGTENTIAGCGVDGNSVCTWDGNNSWTAGSSGMVYMRILPQDPLYDDQTYQYQQGSDDQDFRLWAILENKSDSSIVDSQTRCPGSWDLGDYIVCAD